MSWHVDTAMATRYADGTLGDVGSSSIEAHLISCAVCRGEVGQLASAATLERLWGDTAERIDAPRRTILERLLSTVGVPPHIARVIGVTGALQAVWFVTLLAVSALAIVAANDTAGPLPFLVLAPLVPMAGVALAFSTVTEPAAEIAAASPLGAGRLLLYRGTTLSATAFVVLAICSLALPSLHEAALWVLPALALTSAVLAAGTWFDPGRAAVLLGVAWLGALYVLFVIEPTPVHFVRDPAALLSPAVQLVALVAGAVCSILFFVRRDHVELRTR